MRRLLLALPLALLPFAVTHAAAPMAHASLGAHEHGTARLNAVLDEKTLALELDSPAMNLVGFEHLATSDADKASVAKVRQLLEQPLVLFVLPTGAGCIVASHILNSPLFGDAPDEHDDDDGDEHEHEHEHEHPDAGHPYAHSEIHARYQLQCANPEALSQLDLTPLFKTFPGTHKVQVQLISPSGQQGMETTPANSVLKF